MKLETSWGATLVGVFLLSVSSPFFAPVAQLDRASVSEAEGYRFKSRRAHKKTKKACSEDKPLTF